MLWDPCTSSFTVKSLSCCWVSFLDLSPCAASNEAYLFRGKVDPKDAFTFLRFRFLCILVPWVLAVSVGLKPDYFLSMLWYSQKSQKSLRCYFLFGLSVQSYLEVSWNFERKGNRDCQVHNNASAFSLGSWVLAWVLSFDSILFSNFFFFF